MSGIADIGAAVIGTGFIGTVHVEAAPAHRRPGPGRARQHAGARRSAGSGARRGPCLSQPRRDPRRPRGRRRPRHLAEQPPRPAGPGDPRGRQARRLREAAGDDRGRESPGSSSDAARSGRVNAVNFNIRFYPLNQHVRELVADGGLGDVRFVTGHYFQDWLLLDTDWNWRLEPDKGGALRAVGDIGSHWIDLMQFVTGRRDRVGHGRPGHVHRAPPASRAGPVETFSTERSADTVERPMRDRGRRVDPAALRARRPRRGRRLPDQRRPQELAPVRDRRLDERRGVGLRAARPPLAGPPRPAQRDRSSATRR